MAFCRPLVQGDVGRRAALVGAGSQRSTFDSGTPVLELHLSATVKQILLEQTWGHLKHGAAQHCSLCSVSSALLVCLLLLMKSSFHLCCSVFGVTVAQAVERLVQWLKGCQFSRCSILLTVTCCFLGQKPWFQIPPYGGGSNLPLVCEQMSEWTALQFDQNVITVYSSFDILILHTSLTHFYVQHVGHQRRYHPVCIIDNLHLIMEA